MINRRLFLALLLSVTCRVTWAQGPVGPEFQVNTFTMGTQRGPAVASDPSGNFVVVWTSNGQDGSYTSVFGQRFNAAGVRRGSEFQVNSYTTGYQHDPAVASDASGNFVVVWTSNGQDGSATSVFGQRFNAAGVAQGSEFQVNSYTTGGQFGAAVASDASGNVVVAWSSDGQDGSYYGIFGQRFDATGVRQGGEFQVNTFTTGYQYDVAVASDATGNFVVAWASYGQDGSDYGIFGQRFNAAGAQGGEFQVNTFTMGTQRGPAVASDPSGNFVVAWESNGQDGSNWGVFGQRFDYFGNRQGGEIQVNSYTTGSQGVAAVALAANGNFVVVWTSNGQDGSYGVFGQRFDAAGVHQGGEFQANSYTVGSQDRPAVALAANGDFVVVWQSYGQDGSDYGVFGQRFGDLIFRDGFE